MPAWLAPVGIVLAAAAARWLPSREPITAGRLLASRWAPLAFGIATAGAVWWAWGSLRTLPFLHDEKAFVLQAELFAHGRWIAPAPPIPEFFEQFGVLVTPAVASKMFPGHSLILTPGTWLALPGLVPVLLSGITGALVFALARRATNPWIALLTWILWVTAPWNLRWRASYMSETTTSAAWLGAWWATLRWREHRNTAWLAAIAASVAFGEITRPLTMLAFAMPLGILIFHDVVAHRSWRSLWLPTAIGVAIVSVIPLWSARVTGDWRTTPLALYTRQYIPFDTVGLGYDSTPPLRPLPPDLQAAVDASKPAHHEHTVTNLPRVLVERVTYVVAAVFESWRAWLLPFLAIGLATVRGPALFAVATVAVFLVVHLGYAHGAEWIVYYLETFPIIAFVAAVGVWRSLQVIAGDGARAACAALALAAFAVPLLMRDARDVRAGVSENLTVDSMLHEFFERVPGPAIVFVRYAPDHPPHSSIIVNRADRAEARLWLAYDRGPENARLMRLAPERKAYLLDEARLKLSALPPP